MLHLLISLVFMQMYINYKNNLTFFITLNLINYTNNQTCKGNHAFKPLKSE